MWNDRCDNRKFETLCVIFDLKQVLQLVETWESFYLLNLFEYNSNESCLMTIYLFDIVKVICHGHGLKREVWYGLIKILIHFSNVTWTICTSTCTHFTLRDLHFIRLLSLCERKFENGHHGFSRINLNIIYNWLFDSMNWTMREKACKIASFLFHSRQIPLVCALCMVIWRVCSNKKCYVIAYVYYSEHHFTSQVTRAYVGPTNSPSN